MSSATLPKQIKKTGSVQSLSSTNYVTKKKNKVIGKKASEKQIMI